MLKSLFGDLTPPNGATDKPGDFAATAILETSSSEVNDRGQIVDRHLKDLFVTGSPAQAMRAHFAATHEGQSVGTRLVGLYDPSRMWAASVIKALADASGQPIERLHLRDQATLGTLAMIERTTLPRRSDDALKIYAADVRADTREAADIPIALMERCDLAAVIIGPMQPAAVDATLTSLLAACTSPLWHCPRMLFMLPVGAVWIANKVESMPWPRSLNVGIISEPLTSASAVWNALLSHWNRVKPPAGQSPLLEPATGWGADDFPIKVSELQAAAPSPGADRVPTQVSTRPGLPGATVRPSADRLGGPTIGRPPTAETADAALQEVARLEGVIYAAVVDSGTSHVLASHGRAADMDVAGAAATEIMRTHRRSLRHLGPSRPNDPVDEVVLTSGNRYYVLRTVQSYPDLFILVALDKLRTNLSMARLRLMEVQQGLGGG